VLHIHGPIQELVELETVYLGLLSRMTLLGWADLSYILPVTSVGYVLTAFLGRYFFSEQISWQRWLGTGLIMIGSSLVGLTSSNTTEKRP
jgi:drug/metabolite transporter (DMT)-like permease